MLEMLPDDFIAAVRQQADIVSIVAEYVELKRAGRNYLGLCPFHSEKTPSFNVSPERGSYHCFGCHEGGDVFRFLMRQGSLTFREAVERVAEKVGMALPTQELTQVERARVEKRARWQEAHRLAAEYYGRTLQEEGGREALSYLARRGITAETALTFRLGYAPPLWDGLLTVLRGASFTDAELRDFGLATAKEDSTHLYDRFRARLMFPILDVRGKVIAFGGRVLDESLPKYINSPETAFFEKGHHLYGINTAHRRMREAGHAILAEGYMDVIALHRAGLTQAVASLGTALTREQAREIGRYTKQVIILYDNDAAGRQATLRAGEILHSEDMHAQVGTLGEAKDPDEFLATHSTAELQALLKNSWSYIEYKYHSLATAQGKNTITERAALIRALAPDISRITSRAEREGYERLLSRELGLTLETVRAEIAAVRTTSRVNRQKPTPVVASAQAEKSRQVGVPLGVFRAEQLILRLVLENPELKAQVEAALSADFWLLSEHKFLYEHAENPHINTGDEAFYDACQKRMAEVNALEAEFSQPTVLLADCVQTISRAREKQELTSMQAEMIQLEKTGDLAGALSLLKNIQRILQEKGT